MLKIIILEGLPLIGKTTIINYIKSLKNRNIHCVDELIIQTKELDQESFMKNDMAKINKYNDGLVFIDKGLISTLSYNQMIDYLGGNKDVKIVTDWFKKEGVPFYKRDDVYTIYLTNNKKKLRHHNRNIPHGSIKNQLMMEEITIKNIKKYCKNYEIRNYKYDEMEIFVNEIINKYL